MNHCLMFSIPNRIIDRTGGVHRIASHLRALGWDCEVVDFTEFWLLEELQQLVASRVTQNTKFIGFGHLVNRTRYNKTLIIPLARWIRKTYPDIMLLSGGQSQSVSSDHVDYHVAGYGEYAIEALLKWKFSNGPQPTFGLLPDGRTKFINALHSYPAYPMRDPMIKYEDRDFLVPGEWGKIEFSRGCKFSCRFCNFPVLGVTGDYTRDADSAREQMMDAYDRFGIENYLITDETFNDTTEKITKFADMVDTLPWDPYFVGFVRADLLISRKRDRHELLRMGMLGQFYGIETFNAETLKYIGKGLSPDKMKKGLVEVKNFFMKHAGHRYRANMNLIAGLPHETLESLESTRQWIKDNWMDQVAGACPLEIAQPDDPRASELSNDYKKLGYEILPEVKFAELPPCEYFTPGTVWAADEILTMNVNTHPPIGWKNQHMDVYQAWDWSLSLESLFKVGGHDLTKIEGYLLSQCLSDDNGIPLSLDKKLSLVSATARPYRLNFLKFFENYKTKKLNL